MYQSIFASLHFKRPLTSGNLGLGHFQQFFDISAGLCVSFFCISSPSFVQVCGRTFHRSFHTSYSGDALLKEAPWHPIILSMLEDIPCWCPTVKNVIMNASIDQMLKGLPSAHLTLWLLELCAVQTRVLAISF